MGRSGAVNSEPDLSGLLCRPQVLVDLLETCLAGGATQPLAEIVMRDAALSARVVHAASKSGRGRLDASEPVSSAIQLLGVQVLTGVALQAAKQVVTQDFSAAALRYLNSLWSASNFAGLTARCLAPTVGYLHVEEAQFCALLLNLGMHVQFARYGNEYVALAGKPSSSPELCWRERKEYRIDHLQIAEQLISPWSLDSFLVDAVRFLHSDVAEIESCGQLLKIARLAFSISRHPEGLDPDTEQLAERLFQFRDSEIDYLYHWAHGLHHSTAPDLDSPQQLREELNTARGRLIDLIFALADQAGARARLIGYGRPELLIDEARDLYLENSSATEAIFLLLDHNNGQLVGVAAPGQPRLIGELRIKLDAAGSLVVKALISGEVISSVASTKPLSVTDQLLVRICGGKGFFCRPLRLDGRLLGAVVLGDEPDRQLSSLQELRLRMFDQVMSEALDRLAAGGQEVFGVGSGVLQKLGHELGNSLIIIANAAEQTSQRLGAEERDLTESIKNEVRRIDDLLSSQLNRQDLPKFPDRHVSLNQLVNEAVDSLRQTELKHRQVNIRFDLKQDLEKVDTNGELVKQVLVNLLKNAVHSTESGGEISLATRDSYCSDGGRFVEVVVQDNAAVRPPSTRQLRQPAAGRATDIASAGLDKVKGMVDDLGGRISYHRSAVSGTGFHLQLPCGE